MHTPALVVTGRHWRLLLPTLQAAAACGIRHRVLVGDASTWPFRWSTACTRHVQVDLDDDAAVAAALRMLAREQPRAVLAPADCEATRQVDRLRRRLALPWPTIPVADGATLDLLDDKASFQGLCERLGLAVPLAVTAPGLPALGHAALVARLGLPYVVKPTRCSGSLGVAVVRSAADFDRLQRTPGYPPGPVVVQRWIEGSDIDADLYAVRGRLHALVVHEVQGHRMRFLRHAGLEAMVARLCEATGYSGPMNLDARLERGTGAIHLVEANPRFWASLAAPARRGFNVVRLALQAMDGVADPPHSLVPCWASTRHPLLRPADWRAVLAGRGDEARLLRATVLDPYALARLGQSVPGMALRTLARGAATARRGMRPRTAGSLLP